MKKDKIHFFDRDNQTQRYSYLTTTACGLSIQLFTYTIDPDEVTCESCKNTKAYVKYKKEREQR